MEIIEVIEVVFRDENQESYGETIGVSLGEEFAAINGAPGKVTGLEVKHREDVFPTLVVYCGDVAIVYPNCHILRYVATVRR